MGNTIDSRHRNDTLLRLVRITYYEKENRKLVYPMQTDPTVPDIDGWRQSIVVRISRSSILSYTIHPGPMGLGYGIEWYMVCIDRKAAKKVNIRVTRNAFDASRIPGNASSRFHFTSSSLLPNPRKILPHSYFLSILSCQAEEERDCTRCKFFA